MRSFPDAISRSVDLLELAASRIFHDQRPCVIRLAQGQRVGMTRSAIAPERFLGNFGYMRSAHDNRDTGGTDRIRHTVGFGDHAGHRPDPDQSDPFVDNELDQIGVTHGACIAIDQNDFMAGGRERLQQKHPEMRHEVLRDAVVGVIEKDFQFCFRALFDSEPELELHPATAVEITTRSDIDLILLGSRGSQNLFYLMAGLKATRPDLRILVTGIGADDETMLKALIAGAKGYVDEAATPAESAQAIAVRTAVKQSTALAEVLLPEAQSPLRSRSLPQLKLLAALHQPSAVVHRWPYPERDRRGNATYVSP